MYIARRTPQYRTCQGYALTLVPAKSHMKTSYFTELLCLALLITIQLSTFCESFHHHSKHHKLNPNRNQVRSTPQTSPFLRCSQLTAVAQLESVGLVSTCLQSVQLNDIYRYLVIGSAAGGLRALSRGITYPFDTIKTLSQASDGDTRAYTKGAPKLSIGLYFRGVLPAVLSAIPANALFFMFYNTMIIWSSCLLGDTNHVVGEQELLIRRMIISAVATLPQNAIKIPFELIKQRAQTSPTLSYLEIYRQLVTSIGWRGLYRGGGAQLIREIPYNAFQMAIFALLVDLVGDYLHEDVSSSPTFSAVLGLLASSSAALLTQPADVIKTKMMTDTIPNEQLMSNQASNPVQNLVRCVREVYIDEGSAGFFVGLRERLYIVTIGGVLYFWGSSVANNWFLSLK